MCQISPSPTRLAICERIIAAQASYKMAPDGNAQAELRRVIAVYGESLWDILTRYMRGEIGEMVLQFHFREICRTAHVDAHALGQELFSGHAILGLARDRGTMLSIGEESYFRGFVAALQMRDPRYWDAANGAWRFDQVARRAEMYLPKAEGSANVGVLAQAKPSAMVKWFLGVADHCADCIVMADGSPYYRETLPFMPREYETACRGNCKCTVQVDDVAAFDPVEYDLVRRLGLAA